MDFVDEKSILYLREICAQCGNPVSWPTSKELRLCKVCFEERCDIESDLRGKVKRHFNMKRALGIRRCFLKLLLAHEVDLDPSGWRTGLAVGCELRDAGFDIDESKLILIHAGGKAERVAKLLDVVYGKKMILPLTCRQIKGLDMTCHECPQQFQVKQRESITEIVESSLDCDLLAQ